MQVEIEVAFYSLKQKHRKAILGLRHPVTIVKYSSDVPGPYCMAAVDKFGLQFIVGTWQSSHVIFNLVKKPLVLVENNTQKNKTNNVSNEKKNYT